MEVDYYEMGRTIERNVLACGRTISFAEVLERRPYTKILKFLKRDEKEGIELEIQPDIPTYPVQDIRKTERLCVFFDQDEMTVPEVRAMRKDFPSELLHLNLTKPDMPKSLCLFEEDYRWVCRTMTWEQFLLRILMWFKRAAHDEQHLADQPLEPFLLTNKKVIFDPEDLARDLVDQVLVCVLLAEKPWPVYCVQPVHIDKKMPQQSCYVAVPIYTQAWPSRVINETPTSVAGLHTLLKETVGFDLIEELQRKTVEFYHKIEKFDKGIRRVLMNGRWLLVVMLPKVREAEGKTETVEKLAFFVLESIGEVGRKLGVLEASDGIWGRVLIDVAPHKLDSCELEIAIPISTFDRGLAKRMAGVEEKETVEITAIGAGAIGSQVILNLARMGIGKWSIIDEDLMLPHNSSRHALPPRFDGRAKANALAEEISVLLNNEVAARGILGDVIQDLVENAEVRDAIETADRILDCSASAAVSRHLANVDKRGPITCLYLMQGGRYLIILDEGLDRKIRLDDLEVQLAVASYEDSNLLGMLRAKNMSGIRYGGACREVTTVLAQDVVGTHSGIAARYFRDNIRTSEPSINVWELQKKEISIARHSINVDIVKVVNKNGWEIRISKHAIDMMKDYRKKKLPNETGGVLLGSIDRIAQIIYIGTVLPSPPDSIEWPRQYIRGIKGLKNKVEAIKTETGENLWYIGEWHTHGSGVSSQPSLLDIEAHKKVVAYMSEEGYPGVMLIQGGRGNPFVIVGNNLRGINN